MKPAPYGPFPYSPIINRPKLTWPDGAHVALWVIPNIEFFALMEKVPAASGGAGSRCRTCRPGRRATMATASACSA